MRCEDVFMDILGGLDEKLVTMAMPRCVGDTAAVESQTVSLSTERYSFNGVNDPEGAITENDGNYPRPLAAAVP